MAASTDVDVAVETAVSQRANRGRRASFRAEFPCAAAAGAGASG